MSEDKVEIVRAVYEAWARGRLEAGLDLYDADVMFIPRQRVAFAGQRLPVAQPQISSRSP